MSRGNPSRAAGVAAFLLGMLLVAGGAVVAVLLLNDEGTPGAVTFATTTTTTAVATSGTAGPTVPESTSLPSTTAPPTTVPLRLVCRDAECLSGATVDYLIVTRPMFVEALAGFIDWKSGVGFSVGLVTVDWLDSGFAGDDVAERMKAGMHEIRRRAAGGGTLFVLLVGDTQVARDDYSIEAMRASFDLAQPWNTPTGYYRRIDSDPPGIILPSDAYFVEDADWDPGGTGLNPIGGPNGQGSMVATLYLGRWPVRTGAEVAVVAAKTMALIPTDTVLLSSDVEFETGGCCDRWPPSDAMFGTGTKACCYLDGKVLQDRLLGDNAPWITTEAWSVDLNVPGDDAFRRFLAGRGAAFVTFHGMYECISMTPGVCVDAATMRFEQPFPLLDAFACFIAAFYSGETDTLSEGILKQPVGPAVVSQAGHNEYGYLERLLQGRPVGQAFWEAAGDFVFWPNPILLLGDPSVIVVRGPD